MYFIIPALKNTLVWPSLHLSFIASIDSRMILVQPFKSGIVAWTSFGLMMMNRWTKSG